MSRSTRPEVLATGESCSGQKCMLQQAINVLDQQRLQADLRSNHVRRDKVDGDTTSATQSASVQAGSCSSPRCLLQQWQAAQQQERIFSMIRGNTTRGDKVDGIPTPRMQGQRPSYSRQGASFGRNSMPDKPFRPWRFRRY